MIRRAKEKDINKLLYQVLDVHQKGRPDVFKSNTKKYTNEQLEVIIKDDRRPIFVLEHNKRVLGYAFLFFNYI